jgi:hypothetical protein
MITTLQASPILTSIVIKHIRDGKMAFLTPLRDAPIATTDTASDYGSDIDDETAFSLLSQAESQPLPAAIVASIEDLPSPGHDEAVEQRIHLRSSQLQQSDSKIDSLIKTRRSRQASVEIEYDEPNRGSFSRKSCASRALNWELTR